MNEWINERFVAKTDGEIRVVYGKNDCPIANIIFAKTGYRRSVAKISIKNLLFKSIAKLVMLILLLGDSSKIRARLISSCSNRFYVLVFYGRISLLDMVAHVFKTFF